MKAAVRTRYGPPEVVRLEEVDKPTAGDDELLIKVRATTVNWTDCGYRGGAPFLIRFFSGLRRPKVAILGTEFAGEVEAVGTDVTSYGLGDRVCGYCEGTFGAHAEYMTIQAKRLIASIPGDSTFEEAAPSTEGSHYALGMLRSAKVRNGHDVLIYGATGAIGSAAVQTAKPWSRAWGPTGSSTTRPQTSRRISRGTTWFSMRSARAPSVDAGGC